MYGLIDQPKGILCYKIMNNLFFSWFIFIMFLIIINIVLYFYNNRKSYLFTVNIETLQLINGRCIHYITFKKIIGTLNWRSEYYFKVMLNVILQLLHHLNVDSSFSIVFFDYDPNTNIYKAISDGYIIHFNKNVTVNDLYSSIKWTDFSNSKNNDVVVIIKTI